MPQYWGPPRCPSLMHRQAKCVCIQKHNEPDIQKSGLISRTELRGKNKNIYSYLLLLYLNLGKIHNNKNHFLRLQSETIDAYKVGRKTYIDKVLTFLTLMFIYYIWTIILTTKELKPRIVQRFLVYFKIFSFKIWVKLSKLCLLLKKVVFL